MNDAWRTKPTDRFVLKWIKLHLSSRITPHLLAWDWLRPWMLTLVSALVGVLAGAVFALGWGFAAGCLAAFSQVLDGVDGQFARLTGQQSKPGALLDSVLDRYADGAMMIGLVIYLVRLPFPLPSGLLLAMGALAFIGSGCISYSTARAEALGLDLGTPTLASKGTRSSVMVLCAWGSAIWPGLPMAALIYLTLHSNAVIIDRLIRSHQSASTS